MGEHNRNARNISLHLSHALDDIGLNEETVKFRRKTHLFLEKMYLVSQESNVYNFGSQTEGTTTPGLDSDLDLLTACNLHTVIQNMSEWTPGKTNLLMLQENTAPGYCRLQLMKKDKPEPEDTPPSERFIYDSKHGVIVPNQMFYLSAQMKVNIDRKGPALNIILIHGAQATDNIMALRCKSSLTVTEEWASRDRSGDWPSQALIKRIAKEDIFLVPVGYKLSETPDLEWRISTSLAERQLMFSFNIVQIKCYVLMKMLVKTYVTPQLDDCITSYHCKTVMFYCMEDTEAEFWQESNLLQCVTQCFRRLYCLVVDEFCPHYIMANANLFAGKVTRTNKSTLLSLLMKLIQYTGIYLTCVGIDGLGQMFWRNLTRSAVQQSKYVFNPNATVDIIGKLELSRRVNIALFKMNSVRDALLVCKRIPVTIYIMARIIMLQNAIREADTLEKKVIGCYIEFLTQWFGFTEFSFSLSCDESVQKECEAMFNSRGNFDITSKLKMASVCHCNGDFVFSELLLHQISEYLNGKTIQPVCGCYYRDLRHFAFEFHRTLYKTKDEATRDGLFASCVVFTKFEMHCAPTPLRYEMFRSIRDVNTGMRKESNEPMTIKDINDMANIAAVDYLPFLYFLQYITYRNLGKHEQQRKQILRNFFLCNIEDYGHFNHMETAWNLLGQCLEMEHQPDGALQCYRASLALRHEDNAANWLGVILLYKCAKQLDNGQQEEFE